MGFDKVDADVAKASKEIDPSDRQPAAKATTSQCAIRFLRADESICPTAAHIGTVDFPKLETHPSQFLSREYIQLHAPDRDPHLPTV